MTAAVKCIELCKTYRQGDTDIKALDHLSIDVETGGFVCLSSPSGGGKTTLLNAIGGLDKPDSGEVWVSGQRVAVARAVVSRPALVLADEPTANLDSKTSDALMDLFSELNERHKTTFIIATHDRRVMAHVPRLIKMLDGRIVNDIAQTPV